MRYTVLAFLFVSLYNTEGDSEPLVNFGSDIQRIQEIARDFYEQIQTPVDRLQNLFREKFAPTLWCGIRNSAPFPDALSAVYPHLDSCCRSHDNCDLVIERGECFENVCNPSFLVPILSCECEEEFRKCLKSLPSASTLPQFPITWTERLLADITGFSYFGVLPLALGHDCIERTKPSFECKNYNSTSQQCDEYEEKTQANWSIKSVYEDFEPYEWFKPQSYISDIVDTNSIKENIQDFYQKNFYSIEDN